MWTDILHQLHHGLRPDKLDLLHGQSTRRVELRSLLLERVECVKTEQLVNDVHRDGIELVRERLGLQSLVEVLDNEVLRMSSGETQEVDEEGVPGALLNVAVLKSLKGEVSRAPAESGNDIRVGVEDIESATTVLCVEEGAEVVGSVVDWSLALDDGTCGLEKCLRHLLGKHVVVAFPGNRWEVVGVESTDAGVGGVAVAAHGAAGDFKTLGCGGGSESLEAAGCGVQVCEELAGLLELAGAAGGNGRAHLLLVGVVHLHHGLAGEVEGKGGSEEWEETPLDGGVVEDLVLGRVVGEIVTVLELATDCAVADGNGDATGKLVTGLENDGGANPGHGSVGERLVDWLDIPVGLLVDAGVPGHHVDVWDLDVVEEEETVVHSVVAKLWSNVTNVDVLKWLVSLQVPNLDNEWMWSV